MGQSILLRLSIRCTVWLWNSTFPLKNIEIIKNKCLRGSRSLNFGGKGYKIFGLDGHTFDRRWVFLYREGDNNYSISMTIYVYNPQVIVITLNIKLFCCKNHRSSHWRCSLKERVLKNFASNFIKNRPQHRCFLLKLTKFLRTSIFKNICERLLLQDITEKNYSSISFTKLLGLYNYYYNLSGLKVSFVLLCIYSFW